MDLGFYTLPRQHDSATASSFCAVFAAFMFAGSHYLCGWELEGGFYLLDKILFREVRREGMVV